VSVAITQYKNYVGGEWVESSSGETMPVLNPSTGETIAEVPRGNAEDVSRAVAAARKALPDWLEKTPKDRMELLLALANVIDEHADELVTTSASSPGRPATSRASRRRSTSRATPR
jgi:acyl-CoA reductase-like NAD-dependent aldehyde dehydrogenase